MLEGFLTGLLRTAGPHRLVTVRAGVGHAIHRVGVVSPETLAAAAVLQAVIALVAAEQLCLLVNDGAHNVGRRQHSRDIVHDVDYDTIMVGLMHLLHVFSQARGRQAGLRSGRTMCAAAPNSAATDRPHFAHARSPARSSAPSTRHDG
jgi:hypothetical protein